MHDRPAPLTALRAFEAAARHMSFARAAEELSVTPAALSFQIKALEEHLGQPVFRRLNRAVELTEAGRTLAPGLSRGFDEIAQAWRTTRRLADTRTLTITAGPAFTAKWLAPRLFGFASAFPDIELRFSATFRILDLERDPVDIAIRFGETPDDGLFARTLLRDWVTPMMTPALAQGIREPGDLQNAPLLHQDDISFLRHPIDWPAWFRASGLGTAPTSGPRFSQADHALDAALAGAGVVLGRAAFATPELTSGRLVAPFDLALRTNARYRLVCAEGAETRPQIAAFLAWIEQEIEKLPDLSAGRRFIDAADIPPP